MKGLAAALGILLLGASLESRPEEPSIRVGIIGLDTSHVIEFTRILNDTSAPDYVSGASVVAAFKGGSPDLESSAGRVDGYTAQLRDKWKIEILPDIPSLCSKVDAVLLESVDGRVHLEQARLVFAARKRVFIDKPLAASLEDARTIARLARESGVPWFSASSLRFHPAVQSLKGDPKVGAIEGCDAYSPAPIEPHHPDLYWYGVHGVEILFTLMGPGCRSVTRISTPGTDIVAGKWADGRIGVFRGTRTGAHVYGATCFGSSGVASREAAGGSMYKALVEEIVKFFRTGVPPVSPDETLEIFTFMQAAQVSKERGGQEVAMSDIVR